MGNTSYTVKIYIKETSNQSFILILKDKEGDDKKGDDKKYNLTEVREKIQENTSSPQKWIFVKDRADIDEKDESGIELDSILKDEEIHIRKITEVDSEGDINYRLEIKFDDKEDLIVRMFKSKKKEDTISLDEIRKKVGKLRDDKGEWFFKDLNKQKVKKEKEVVTFLNNICEPIISIKDKKKSIKGTIYLQFIKSTYTEGKDARYDLSFKFKDKNQATKFILEFQNGPDKVTLESIRNKLKEEKKKLRNDLKKWIFISPDEEEIKEESRYVLKDLYEISEDSTSDITTFKADVNVLVVRIVPGTWDGKPITDIELISAIESGDAESVPYDFIGIPDGKPIDSLTDYSQWSDIGNSDKFSIVKNNARLYYGFNMPKLEHEFKLNDFDQFDKELLGLPQLERYESVDSNRWIISQKIDEKIEILGSDSNKGIYRKLYEGRTRTAVEKEHNLAVTTKANVSVPEYGAFEAEYSHAEASATSSTEEKIFLIDESIINKVEVTLPIGTDGKISKEDSEETGLILNYNFTNITDRANTAKELYQIMEDWGSLIAQKVTIGGAYYFATAQLITSDFSEKQIKDAWEIKIDASINGVDVGVGNQGQTADLLRNQENVNKSATIINAYGGKPEYALNKQYKDWLTTLQKPKYWKPLKRENIFPIYVILDKYRKKRFARIIAEGGKTEWQKHHNKSKNYKPFRFIDFDWFISFGQKDTQDRLS